MSYANLLEGKVISNGKEILSICGEVHEYVISPGINFFITDVKEGNDLKEKNIVFPYKQGDFLSLEKFTKKLYDFRNSVDKEFKLPVPSSEIYINIKSVVEGVD